VTLTFFPSPRTEKTLVDIRKAIQGIAKNRTLENTIGARGFEPPTPCSQGKTKNKKWLVCLACQRQKRVFLGNSITIYHSVILYTFNDF